MSRDNNKHPFLKTLVRAIPFQIKSAPCHFVINNAIAILHGFSFAAQVFVTKILFDAIADAATGNAGFIDCLIPLSILAGVIFGQQILNGIHNFHGISILWPKSTGKLTSLLNRKLQRIDPVKYEETDFLDDVNKAREGAKEISMFTIAMFMLIFFYGVYFASVGAYLFWLKPMLLVTLLLAFVPAMLSQIVRTRVFTKLEEQSAPLRREHEYYQRALCDREYFKETRILGAFSFFHKLFSDTLILLTRKQWKAERKTALLQLILNITTFAGMAVAAYLLFTATLNGEITVGAFAAVFTSLNMIFLIMQEIISWHIGNMSRNIGKVGNFIRVLDLPERKGTDGMTDFTKGVIAENISFTYPGRDNPAVSDVSLTIKDGETIAVVGENGAGKSTLVRLLIGVYQPSEGTVKIGGQDTSLISTASIYQSISSVFQKYQRYKMTLEENVSISDTDVEIDSKRVDNALSQADAQLDIEPSSMLSPEFDGIDLSGGQWQRVAIARGLYRTNYFIVLDEPTSAIDPLEETRIYSQFRELAKEKCAILVTHRLGSAKLAHRVIVMDAGKIIDEGTHDELLTRPGKYANMWAAQAQWYERQTDVV